MDFVDFHIVARKETSDGLCELLRRAGIRIHQRANDEIGQPEYVIAVQPDDVEKASQFFWNGVGQGGTFTSDGN